MAETSLLTLQGTQTLNLCSTETHIGADSHLLGAAFLWGRSAFSHVWSDHENLALHKSVRSPVPLVLMALFTELLRGQKRCGIQLSPESVWPQRTPHCLTNYYKRQTPVTQETLPPHPIITPHGLDMKKLHPNSSDGWGAFDSRLLLVSGAQAACYLNVSLRKVGRLEPILTSLKTNRDQMSTEGWFGFCQQRTNTIRSCSWPNLFKVS